MTVGFDNDLSLNRPGERLIYQEVVDATADLQPLSEQGATSGVKAVLITVSGNCRLAMNFVDAEGALTGAASLSTTAPVTTANDPDVPPTYGQWGGYLVKGIPLRFEAPSGNTINQISVFSNDNVTIAVNYIG